MFFLDGIGYFYMQDDYLMKVLFDYYFIEQISFDFFSGELMGGYMISFDGKCLVLIMCKGDFLFLSDWMVNIVSYWSCFVEVCKVGCVVVDDFKKE